ncbi:MAG TPA: hypothetical protein VF440_01150 [Novosphingobium sp.]
MTDLPPSAPTQEQIIERKLLDCGLDARGISVKYEDELQSIEIRIRPASGATADHFKCIRDAAGHEIATFEDGKMFLAYSDYASEEARPQVLEMFKDGLRKRNLLEGFPERGSFANLADYARALELHGKISPGSTLQVSGDEIVFDPAHDQKSPADFVEKYSDLLAIVGYACALERIKFGFIGNAAAP